MRAINTKTSSRAHHEDNTARSQIGAPGRQCRLNIGTLVQRELQDTQFRPMTGWMSLSRHPTMRAHTWSSMVTPLMHQWDRHPWMRQSQAPLATWEGTCPPHSTPELPHWQWQDDAAPRCNQGCTPGLGQAAQPCAPLLTALPMSTFVPRTYNLHAAAQSKHITMLGRDGCVLPCSQGNALITAVASPPSHSS